MIFLIFSGIVALIFGVLLLTIPGKMNNVNTRTNRIINKLITDIDKFVYKYNQGVGICLLLSGIVLIFVAYYLYKT